MKFKRNEQGEYESGIYKILKNEVTREWHLYVFVDGEWEWSIEGRSKRELKVMVQLHEEMPHLLFGDIQQALR